MALTLIKILIYEKEIISLNLVGHSCNLQIINKTLIKNKTGFVPKGFQHFIGSLILILVFVSNKCKLDIIFRIHSHDPADQYLLFTAGAQITTFVQDG